MNPFIKHILSNKLTYQKKDWCQIYFLKNYLIWLSVTYNNELFLLEIDFLLGTTLLDIKNDISKKCKRCNNSYIFPITIFGHFLFVIFYKKENQFIIVDSSGYSNKQKYIKKFKFLFGNNIGFFNQTFQLQNIEHKNSIYFYDEIDGYCMFWGLLIIEHLLIFNKQLLKNIISNIFEVENLRELIRKYHTYSTNKIFTIK